MGLQEQKTKNLTETIFDFLATDLHNKNDFSNAFVKRSIANALYQQGPKIKSGLISIKAKESLEEGKLDRHRLCYEHPYPRTRTAIDLINSFDSKFKEVSNTYIKEDLSNIIERGCKVHLVLSEENQKLYPFQQDYSLTEEEIYSKANVHLVTDDLILNRNTYIYNDSKYYSIPEISEKVGITKYKVKKMISNGEIIKGDNK